MLPRGNALHEVEGGQQQELLGIGPHVQQDVLAQLARKGTRAGSPPAVGAELCDHLLDEVRRHTFW